MIPVSQKGCQALDQVAQGSGGVTISGGVQKLCGWGPCVRGLVDLAVLD